MELIIKGRQHVRLPLFGWLWPVASLIESDWRTFWSAIRMRRINWYLYFFHGINHQGKVTFKTTTLGWVGPDVPLGESDPKFFGSSISRRNQLISLSEHYQSFFDLFLFIFIKHFGCSFSPDVFSMVLRLIDSFE